ncbi:G-protein coupled receptor 39-like [Mercenaria mercenaria]|uniref:G-protein coupled receptor 39-like n=1 Tax=Mercenaria mercenaria TaxID=6596 RepID=UPI001E1D8B79|nr:G-protein coupled receptor 39-like [Mercenaria mercenaria]
MDSGQQTGSQIPRLIWIIGTPIVFCIGIVGNVITITVLSKKNQKKSSTTVFLTVLAITDLLVMTISLPRWWLIYMFGIDVRHLSNGMCKFHWFLTYFDSAVSISILVAVTIERVISTVKPFKMKTFCTVKSAVIISGAIVIAMVLTYGHVLYGLELFHKEIPNRSNGNTNNDAETLTVNENVITNLTETTSNRQDSDINRNCSMFNLKKTSNCSTQQLLVENATFSEEGTGVSTHLIKMCWFKNPNYGKFYSGAFQIMNILLYNVIPETIFLVSGIIIVRKLTTSRKRVAPEGPRRTRNQQTINRADVQSKQITVSLLFVNVVFFICTTPIFIFLLGRSVWIDTENGMTETQEIIWAIFNLLFYTNHAVNFILYFLSGARFRQQVMDTLHCRKSTIIDITSRSQVSSV